MPEEITLYAILEWQEKKISKKPKTNHKCPASFAQKLPDKQKMLFEFKSISYCWVFPLTFCLICYFPHLHHYILAEAMVTVDFKQLQHHTQEMSEPHLR